MHYFVKEKVMNTLEFAIFCVHEWVIRGLSVNKAVDLVSKRLHIDPWLLIDEV